MKTLIKSDMKYMGRDPMMYGMVIMPMAMTLIYRVGLTYLNFLEPYVGVIQYFFVTMASLFVGIILGLRILDEKDENLLQFYAVTPIRLRGYYRYKNGLCVGVVALIVSLLQIGIGVEPQMMGVITLYGVGIGVVAMLGMSMLAKNKIQGMVLAKGLGVLVLLPCVRLLGENQIDPILRILPWDYMYTLLVLEQFQWQTYTRYIVALLLMVGYLYHKGQHKA